MTVPGGRAARVVLLAAAIGSPAAVGTAPAQEGGWSPGFLRYVDGGPNSQALASGHGAVLRGIYGDAPLEVAVQDFDQDGDPEYIVRHLSNCETLTGHASRGLIAVCPWTVIDRRGGRMAEVLRESGWRSRSLVRDGHTVGFSLDGLNWIGSPDHPGHMLGVVDPVIWGGRIEEHALELLESQFGTVHEFRVAELEVASRKVLLAHDRGGGASAVWALFHNGRLLQAGRARGEPLPAISRLGMLRLNDSATGKELSRIMFPLTEGTWWFLWERPVMPAGWRPLRAKEQRNVVDDPDGLWLPGELRDTGEASAIWRSATVLEDGRRLVLSWLSGRCGTLACSVRGRLESRAGNRRVLFDGERTGRACVADPHSLALSFAGGALRLWACDRALLLAAEKGGGA